MNRLMLYQINLKSHWLVIPILLAHLAIGSLWSIVTPVWEGYDEWAHYRYVRYLVEKRALPVPEQKLITEMGMLDETSQPPLYYILGALFTSWVDTTDRVRPEVNPYAFTGTGEGGVNVAIHDPQIEGFPYRDSILAVHLLRLMSITLGTIAVWATYLCGRLVFSERPDIVLGSTAFMAFTPQFLFMGSIVNNEILAVTTSSFVLLLTVRMIVRGIRPLDLLLVTLSLGLGFASKYTTIALLPVCGLGLVLATSRSVIRLVGKNHPPLHQPSLERRRVWSRPLFWWAGALISALAVWWVIVKSPYGQSLRDRFVVETHGHLLAIGYYFRQPDTLPWHLLPDALRYGFYTFWASFGWGNVEIADWLYWMFGILTLLGFIGSAILLFRRTTSAATRAIIVLLFFTVFCGIALPLYRELGMWRALLKGRYILVALPAISLLMVTGLTQWSPRRFHATLIASVSLGMFTLALVMPFRYIEPVYTPPLPLSDLEIHSIPHPLQVNFDNTAELLGYDIGAGKVRAGQAIAVTLYWRCLSETDRNYTVAVKILGANTQEYGSVHTYPGRGNFATSLWHVGDTFHETYWVPVASQVPAPCLGQVSVALFDAEEGQRHLQVLDHEGNPTSRIAIWGRIKIRPVERPDYSFNHTLGYELDGQIVLLGYNLETSEIRTEQDGSSTVHLKLYWQAKSRMETDYTVFVHLKDAQGSIVAQSDAQPRSGTYPTSLWDAEEIIEDLQSLPLPRDWSSGSYHLVLGMYELRTMQRLPILDERGDRLLDDQVSIEISATTTGTLSTTAN